MAPTLVLLHGFTHTGASWGPVLQELGESYRGTAPDIRGHGSASDRTPVTLEAVLGDIDAAAPERFTLAGYSMGGRIALQFAIAHPARVERLVLIGASPGIADPVEREARRGADDQLAGEVERSSIEQFAERWATAPILAGQPAKIAEAAREDRLRNHPVGLARALRGLGTGAVPSLWDRLGELAMPITLVVGERDPKFRAIVAQMAGAIPDPTAVVVDGAGHAVHLEAPREVAGIIAGAPA
jgi:2-succinyl-6-hydroxy-2,4-cyclohexadiene-1-carboxylate synthase